MSGTVSRAWHAMMKTMSLLGGGEVGVSVSPPLPDDSSGVGLFLHHERFRSSRLPDMAALREFLSGDDIGGDMIVRTWCGCRYLDAYDPSKVEDAVLAIYGRCDTMRDRDTASSDASSAVLWSGHPVQGPSERSLDSPMSRTSDSSSYACRPMRSPRPDPECVVSVAYPDPVWTTAVSTGSLLEVLVDTKRNVVLAYGVDDHTYLEYDATTVGCIVRVSRDASRRIYASGHPGTYACLCVAVFGDRTCGVLSAEPATVDWVHQVSPPKRFPNTADSYVELKAVMMNDDGEIASVSMYADLGGRDSSDRTALSSDCHLVMVERASGGGFGVSWWCGHPDGLVQARNFALHLASVAFRGFDGARLVAQVPRYGGALWYVPESQRHVDAEW